MQMMLFSLLRRVLIELNMLASGSVKNLFDDMKFENWLVVSKISEEEACEDTFEELGDKKCVQSCKDFDRSLDKFRIVEGIS